MDKAALMRAFKVMCSETSKQMSSKCKLSAAPLMGLKPLELREAHIRSQQLAKEICYEGRVLHATICASAKVGSRLVLCLVEAENEDGASAYLHIFDALSSTSRPDQAEAIFPRDAKIAIKEPLCYCSIMHVSSPASIEFVGLSKQLRRRPVDDLRREGNRLLAKGSYVLAELHFTECVNLFMSRTDKSNFGELEKDVFTGRSQARLKLGRFEEAALDAEFALKITQTEVHNVRSLCTKAGCMQGLEEHQLALDCFQSAAAMEPSTETNFYVQQSQEYLRQSKNGEYDHVPRFLLGEIDSLPKCSEFMGPLELKLTPDGRGRGLFLTADVCLGDLLLVCNPTAAVVDSPEDEADEDMYVELVRACTNSDRRLRQIYAMADSAEMELVPDLTPFKCNVGRVLQRPSSRAVDVERIRRVRNRVGYVTYHRDKYIPGLWASVGLINHSCLPNASKVSYGELVFIRAAKDLRAGEEVLLSYFEQPLAPLPARENAIKQYEFECKCRRCEFERQNRGVLLAGLPCREDLSSKSTLKLDVDDKVMELVLEIEKRVKKLNDEERNWIRAGFPDAYSAVCMLRNPKVPSLEQVLNMFRETGPGNTHTLSRIAFLCNISNRDPLTLKSLRDEATAIYGRQSPEVLNAVTRKYRFSSSAAGFFS